MNTSAAAGMDPMLSSKERLVLRWQPSHTFLVALRCRVETAHGVRCEQNLCETSPRTDDTKTKSA